ncbi:hypothetical protein Tco_1164881 [Tanacetum coccineum]
MLRCDTESPLTIALPISLSESTPLFLVPILRRTARMAVCVPHAMSSGLSTGMAEVTAMSESAFCKRFQSSYESSPSMSPPDLPSRKRYHGTSELVEDSEEDDDEEDEEIEESMNSDSVSKDVDDEGPTAEDEDLALYEGLVLRSDELGLEEDDEEAVPGLHRVTTVIPICPSPSVVPSPISSPMISLIVPSPIATPATAETDGFLTELGASGRVTRGDCFVNHDELRKIGGSYRLLCLRELDEVVDSMRRGQERPRGVVRRANRSNRPDGHGEYQKEL